MTAVAWDDPELEENDEFTEEEMLAIEQGEIFDMSNDYAEELFGMLPVYEEERPFGWDISDMIDYDAFDGESRFDD